MRLKTINKQCLYKEMPEGEASNCSSHHEIRTVLYLAS